MSVTTTPMPPPMRAASAALDTAYAVPVFPPEAVPEHALRLSAVCAVQPFVEQAVMMVLVAVLGIRIVLHPHSSPSMLLMVMEGVRPMAMLMMTDVMMGMAAVRTLRPAEKTARLLLVQQRTYVLSGKEDIIGTEYGVRVHDRSGHVRAGTHGHIDHVFLHHGRPVLVAQRMAKAYGGAESLF